jgi:hypothetical protein
MSGAKLLCRLFGHRLTLDLKQHAKGLGQHEVWRLRCVRCGMCDPYQPR